jgi:Protein of unknown function (DUF433)
MPMKKWPLLDSNPACLGGRPRIDGTRLTTEHVYQYCAGSDSDAHVKMFRGGLALRDRKADQAGNRVREEAPGNLKGNSAIGLGDVGYRIRTLKAATFVIGAA